MPLRGRAFLLLWSGVSGVLQGYKREIDRWHTIEHMPERLGDIANSAEVSHSIASAAPAIARLHGVTAVHIGQHAPEVAAGETAESRLRQAASAPRFSHVVLVEGIGSPELDDAMPNVVDIATAASSGTCEAGVYRLAYLLEAAG